MHMRYLNAALVLAALVVPHQAGAQQTSPFPSSTAVRESAAPSAAQQVTADAAAAARRFHAGIRGGVGLDPVLIEIGGHVTMGPIFTDKLTFRPGIGLGAGEVTTTLGFNLDLLYGLPWSAQSATWGLYAGGGANFALSHESFQADVPVEGTDSTDRFDFSDTEFQTGLNLIFGARRGRMFTEVNATAWGAHNVRLLIGYDF